MSPRPRQQSGGRRSDKELEALLAEDPAPEMLVAGAILETGARISQELRNARLGGQLPLLMADTGEGITIACGSETKLYSEKTRTGSSWRFMQSTSADDTKTAACKDAEKNALQAVRDDLTAQWNFLRCQAGCKKSPLPDPVPASITVAGHITGERPPDWKLGYWGYDAEATASGTLTVKCQSAS